MLGHTPTREELTDAITAGENTRATLRRTTDADRDRDCSTEMSVGYGIDCDDETERQADYRAVRGLE